MSNDWKGLPIVIFGIGGAARDVMILIEDINCHSPAPSFQIVGFIAHDDAYIGQTMCGYPIVASNQTFKNFALQFPILGTSIGLGSPKAKEKIFEKILSESTNIVYPNLIHPRSNVCGKKHQIFGNGLIICAGVTVAYGCELSDFVTYNLNSTIGHDSKTGKFSTINPQAVISGNVQIGSGTLIGAGASIKEKVIVGKECIIGMGAVVVKNVPDFTTVVGVAAKPMGVK